MVAIKNDLEILINILENSMQEQGYKTKKCSQMGISFTNSYDGIILRSEAGKEYILTIGESREYNKKFNEWNLTNYLKDDDTTTMKFYEFNSFGYYALIGAKSEEDAIKYYRETIADVEEDDGPPDEITKEEARAKLIGGCKEDEAEALKEFDIYTNKQDPYLVLIDGGLI